VAAGSKAAAFTAWAIGEGAAATGAGGAATSGVAGPGRLLDRLGRGRLGRRFVVGTGAEPPGTSEQDETGNAEGQGM
jgi:hypothetical protein